MFSVSQPCPDYLRTYDEPNPRETSANALLSTCVAQTTPQRHACLGRRFARRILFQHLQLKHLFSQNTRGNLNGPLSGRRLQGKEDSSVKFYYSSVERRFCSVTYTTARNTFVALRLSLSVRWHNHTFGLFWHKHISTLSRHDNRGKNTNECTDQIITSIGAGSKIWDVCAIIAPISLSRTIMFVLSLWK